MGDALTAMPAILTIQAGGISICHTTGASKGKQIQKSTGGAGGYFPAGIGWYRKTFNVPPAWKDKRVSIYFEGVYMNSEVFINGKSLGVHPYGYTSFSYDLTPYGFQQGKCFLSASR